MSGGGVGNTTNTGNVGGLGSAMGRQVPTQVNNPFNGSNPGASQFLNNQPRPQVLPQVTPQVQQPAPQAVPPAYQNYMQAIVGNPQLGGMGISGVTGGMPAQGMGTPTTYLPPPTTQTEAINRLGGMGIAGVRQLPFQGGMGIGGVGQVPFQGGMGISGGMGDTFNRPLVQPPAGGPERAAFFDNLARNQKQIQNLNNVRAALGGVGQVGQLPFQGGMGIGGIGQVPDYAQPYYQDLMRRQQQPLVSLPRPQPQVQPMPRPQVGLGLAGLANAMRGKR